MSSGSAVNLGMGDDITLVMRLEETPKLFCPLCSKQYVRTKDLMKHVLWLGKNHSSTYCQASADVPKGPVQTFDVMYPSSGNQDLSRQPNEDNSFEFGNNLTPIAPSGQMGDTPSDPAAFSEMRGTISRQHPQELVSYLLPSRSPTQQTGTFLIAPASYTAGGSMEESPTNVIGAASNEIGANEIDCAEVSGSYASGGEYSSNSRYWNYYQQGSENPSEATSHQYNFEP